MRTAYLNTTTSTFYDENGNLWRDGFPQFIVGGNEKIKIVLCTNTENATLESANPAEWMRDLSFALIDNLSAMLTVDSDNIHHIQGTLAAEAVSGSSKITADISESIAELPASGYLRMFEASGAYTALAYTERYVENGRIVFTLDKPLAKTYPINNRLDCRQSPLAMCYLSAESDIANGELIFEMRFDSERLRSTIDYTDAARIDIRGVELLFFVTDADGYIRKLRAYLWDSPSLNNTIGDAGFEADVPDGVMDKINAAVAAAFNTEAYRQLSEI